MISFDGFDFVNSAIIGVEYIQYIVENFFYSTETSSEKFLRESHSTLKVYLGCGSNKFF
jgi:hypothetical protein